MLGATSDGSVGAILQVSAAPQLAAGFTSSASRSPSGGSAGGSDGRGEAHAAQDAWAQLSVAERAQRVRRFRDQIVKRAPELCELISAEGGKTRSEALSMEVMLMADLSTYFCKRAAKILQPESIGLHLLKNRG